MSITVGSRIAACLAARGVRHVFGVPGGQSYALYIGIEDEPNIEHVLMHDERSAGFAADAYARILGLGACDATVGPGATNLPSAVGEAYASSIPLIALISDIPAAWEARRDRGNASQAIRQSELFAGITKWVVRIESPKAVDEVMEHALRVATSGRPGPVVVVVPEDVYQSDVHEFYAVDAGRGAPPLPPRCAPDPADVAAAVQVLASARRPSILAGGGVFLSGGQDALRALVEHLQCPVTTTISGKGCFPEEHPLCIGVAGSMGRSVANDILGESDVILLVGTKAGQVATSGWELPAPATKTIRIDIDPHEIGRRRPDDVRMWSDARVALTALMEAVGAVPLAGRFAWRPEALKDRVASWHDRHVTRLTANAESGLLPQRVLSHVNEQSRANDLLVTDASLSGGWGASYFVTRRTNRPFLAGRGLAGLGWGLPAGIGAAIARRDVGETGRTLVLAGDGGFSYSVQELEVAARLSLPMTVVILNNGVLGWIKHTATSRFGAKYGAIACNYAPINFADVAGGFGVPGQQIATEEGLVAALQRAATTDGPYLVDVRSSGDETPVLKLAQQKTGTLLTGEGL